MANELVVKTEYRLLAGDFNAKEVITANVGNAGINRFDLDRVKVPPAAGNAFIVPGLEGEEYKREIVGIIVAWRDGRVYWHNKMGDGEQTPPDCSSEDAVDGVGDPGGPCDKCPMAQFGSAENGKGQACKLKRLLIMVKQSDVLPFVVTLPTMSVTPMRKYFMRLASNGIPFYAVETSLTLEKARSDGGIEYARVVPKMTRRVDPSMLEALKNLKGDMEKSAASVSVKEE